MANNYDSLDNTIYRMSPRNAEGTSGGGNGPISGGSTDHINTIPGL